MSKKNIIVVGAGVSGLTTALLLSKDKRCRVTLIAKHMPGDQSIEYASPWAGASFMPLAVRGTDEEIWERETWKVFRDLAEHHPGSGIHFRELRVFDRAKDAGSLTANWFAELTNPNPWWKDLLPNYRHLAPSELPRGVDRGQVATSVCINTALYLPWLLSQCLENGVKIRRATLNDLQDVIIMHHTQRKAEVIINCTGLGARSLGGVADCRVYPARGQIVLVRNTSDSICTVSGTDDASTEAMYIMERAGGGGTILGGCYQNHEWESQPDPNLALRIMKRCVESFPALTDGEGIGGLDIIRHAVGLRPAREGGPRLDGEMIGDCYVIHNYGHGGAGYQWSYGCANRVLAILEPYMAMKALL